MRQLRGELPKQVARGTVNRYSWLEFLDVHIRADDNGALRLNGFFLEETPRRAYYRWREEGASPVWYMADAFLCQGDMIWNDFEIWCEVEGMPLWEKDPPDDWD